MRKRSLNESKDECQQVHKRIFFEPEMNCQGILSAIPIGVMRLSFSGEVLYANTIAEQAMGYKGDNSAGKNIKEVLGNEIKELYFNEIAFTLSGRHREFSYTTTQRKHYSVSTSPEYDDNNNILTVLLFIKEQQSIEKTESSIQVDIRKQIDDLRRALDEHAIVAYTDAKGVITAVNEKFCQLSKFSHDELIGSTHRLINSGYHDKTFFMQMWRTIVAGNVWKGEICNKAKDGSIYWVSTTIVPFLNDKGRPYQFIAIRADITDRKQAEEEANRLAFYDDLTGLANRRLLKAKLADIAEHDKSGSGSYYALMLFDLDDFKEINDIYGHLDGDDLLKSIATRLISITPSDSLSVRLGGDEFVFLVHCESDSWGEARKEGLLQAEKLKTCLEPPYQVSNRSLKISISIGLVVFNSLHIGNNNLLKQADIAMYQSKFNGKNQISMFEQQLQIAVDTRNSYAQELRYVLEKDELFLEYQKIYLSEGEAVGVEALVRWNSKVHGWVSPAIFIPLAEESNLINDIGYWVLNEACRVLAAWKQDPQRAEWYISVNLSARQMALEGFVDLIIEMINRNQAPIHNLRLEITESVLLHDVEETIKKIKQLKSLGVSISLDDFGTGYSSFSYLTRLPIDTLKIDKSFISAMLDSKEDQLVVDSILSLATNLGLRVIAEGVETLEQYQFLIDHGCDKFQGFYFSRPVPLDKL